MAIEAELKYTKESGIEENELFNHPDILPFRSGIATIEMHTIYLDTEERDTRENGVSLRLRTENGVPCLTIKTSKSRDGELSVRGEWSVCTDDLTEATQELGRIGAPVSSIEGKRLIKTAEVKFVRKVAKVSPNDEFSFELSLDCGIFKNSGAQFTEIELELQSGTVDELKKYGEALAESLGLYPEPRSKHARALMKA